MITALPEPDSLDLPSEDLHREAIARLRAATAALDQVAQPVPPAPPVRCYRLVARPSRSVRVRRGG